MSRTLRLQLLRTYWTRLLLITGIISLSLSLFIVINIFVTNVNQEISNETKPLVGADIIIEGSQPINDATLSFIANQKENYDIEISKKIEFSTNLSLSGVDSKLVKVWGVEDNYPLYGALTVDQLSNTQSGVLVDPQTYQQFSRDQKIRIGSNTFAIQGLIQSLPAATINVFDEGRTIIIPYEDIESTQLTNIGSRIEYQLLIKSKDIKTNNALLQKIKNNAQITATYQVTNANDRIDQISRITNEFNRFITIVLIIAFVLVVTTIFISLRTFFSKEQRYIAIQKLLGQRNKSTLILYGSLFLCCFLAGRIIAGFIGWASFYGIKMFPLSKNFVFSLSPIRNAGLIGIILAVVSLSIPLLTIATRPPLQLLNPKNIIGKNYTLYAQIGLSLLGMYLIYGITIHDWKGGVLFIGLLGISIALISGYIRLILQAVVKGAKKRSDSLFLYYDGIRYSIAPGNQSILMTIGILVSLICFIVINGLSSSFIQQLDTINGDQPTVYVLNILPEDITYLKETYPNSQLYDSILSRIQKVNNVTLSEHLSAQGKEDGRGLTREFNVTSQELPASGYITGSPPNDGEVSLDEGFATRLGVGIGDSLSFFIQGRTFELTITSLRRTQRDGTGPFFYIQFPINQFSDAPKTYFQLIDVSSENKQTIKEDLIQNVGPHLSFIDTDEIIATVTDITSKLLTIIRVFLRVLMIFIIVSIYVCLDAMKSLKQQKITLYGLLGATMPMIKKTLRSELFVLSSIAIFSAIIIAGALLTYIFVNSDFLQFSGNIIIQITTLIFVIIFVIIAITIWQYRSIINNHLLR